MTISFRCEQPRPCARRFTLRVRERRGASLPTDPLRCGTEWHSVYQRSQSAFTGWALEIERIMRDIPCRQISSINVALVAQHFGLRRCCPIPALPPPADAGGRVALFPSAHPFTNPTAMINVQHLSEERPLNLSAAAAYIGRLTGEKPHTSTIWRWCSKGCKGIRLESICIGGKRYVTVSAIERFIEARSQPDAPRASTIAAEGSRPQHVARHDARRRAEIEAARRRLDVLTNRGGNQDGEAAPLPPTRSA